MMDKKLKMVQLQIQKARLDQQGNKPGAEPIQGQAEEFEDRNTLINAVIEKMNNSDK